MRRVRRFLKPHGEARRWGIRIDLEHIAPRSNRSAFEFEGGDFAGDREFGGCVIRGLQHGHGHPGFLEAFDYERKEALDSGAGSFALRSERGSVDDKGGHLGVR